MSFQLSTVNGEPAFVKAVFKSDEELKRASYTADNVSSAAFQGGRSSNVDALNSHRKALAAYKSSEESHRRSGLEVPRHYAPNIERHKKMISIYKSKVDSFPKPFSGATSYTKEYTPKASLVITDDQGQPMVQAWMPGKNSLATKALGRLIGGGIKIHMQATKLFNGRQAFGSSAGGFQASNAAHKASLGATTKQGHLHASTQHLQAVRPNAKEHDVAGFHNSMAAYHNSAAAGGKVASAHIQEENAAPKTAGSHLEANKIHFGLAQAHTKLGNTADAAFHTSMANFHLGVHKAQVGATGVSASWQLVQDGAEPMFVKAAKKRQDPDTAYEAGQEVGFEGEAADGQASGFFRVKVINPHSNADKVTHRDNRGVAYEGGISHIPTATVENTRSGKRFEAYHHTLRASSSPTLSSIYVKAELTSYTPRSRQAGIQKRKFLSKVRKEYGDLPNDKLLALHKQMMDEDHPDLSGVIGEMQKRRMMASEPRLDSIYVKATGSDSENHAAIKRHDEAFFSTKDPLKQAAHGESKAAYAMSDKVNAGTAFHNAAGLAHDKAANLHHRAAWNAAYEAASNKPNPGGEADKIAKLDPEYLEHKAIADNHHAKSAEAFKRYQSKAKPLQTFYETAGNSDRANRERAYLNGSDD